MNPLSLPGMTQGARKRAAHRDAMRKYEAGYMVGEWSGYSIPWDVCIAEARARYRIGERLRPCRGCHECMPKCATCNGHRSVATTVNDQDGNAIEMPCPICCYWDPCDGSGVLPAKRAGR